MTRKKKLKLNLKLVSALDKKFANGIRGGETTECITNMPTCINQSCTACNQGGGDTGPKESDRCNNGTRDYCKHSEHWNNNYC